MPEWIAREYLGRRGMAKFPREKLVPTRCPLLGYTLQTMQVEGITLPAWLLRVDEQPEVGPAGYDAGTEILTEFFHRELAAFQLHQLDPLGRQIIECCLDGGGVSDYETFLLSVDMVRFGPRKKA
jgi:hypothetical protein